jgi:hypothetical protein
MNTDRHRVPQERRYAEALVYAARTAFVQADNNSRARIAARVPRPSVRRP